MYVAVFTAHSEKRKGMIRKGRCVAEPLSPPTHCKCWGDWLCVMGVVPTSPSSPSLLMTQLWRVGWVVFAGKGEQGLASVNPCSFGTTHRSFLFVVLRHCIQFRGVLRSEEPRPGLDLVDVIDETTSSVNLGAKGTCPSNWWG